MNFGFNPLRQNISSLNHDILFQRMKQSHGGVIGTNGKAVISFRTDDWQDQLKNTIAPLLQARDFPFSHALISRFTAAKTYIVSSATWADILALNKAGMEIWCHSATHQDYTLEGYAGAYREIVTSRAEIEAHNLKVQGFMTPGISGSDPVAGRLGPIVPYGGLTDSSATWDSFKTMEGTMLLNTYPIVESYIWGYERYLPMGLRQGATYYAVEDLTLSQLEAYVDKAINLNCGIEFMIHSGRIGQSGKLSVADLTTFLDYVKTKRDAGLVEVLTSSGQYFADPGSSRRLDLLTDGGFENSSALWQKASGATIETSGGYAGNNFLRHTNSMTTSTIQYRDDLIASGLNGETFEFVGMCRSNGASTTTARVILQDYDNHSDNVSGLSISRTYSGITTTWTKVRQQFSLLTTTNKLTIGLARSAGDGIDWDDVHVYKV